MIQTNYEAIPDKLFKNYLDFLVSKVYKILPMRESNTATLKAYMASLMRELLGNEELIIELKYNPNFLCLLGKLEYLIQNDVDIKTYRKDIFDCITLINKMQEVMDCGKLEHI